MASQTRATMANLLARSNAFSTIHLGTDKSIWSKLLEECYIFIDSKTNKLQNGKHCDRKGK